MLVPSSDDTERGALARVERLERRIGVEQDAAAPAARVTPARPAVELVETPPVTAARAKTRGSASRGLDKLDHRTSDHRGDGLDKLDHRHLDHRQPDHRTRRREGRGRGHPRAAANAWPEVLESVQKTKMSAWAVVYTATARALDGDVLTLSFVSQADVDSFKQPQGSGEGVSEVLRRAIVEVLGLRVKFIAKADASAEPPAAAPTTSVTPPVSEKDAQGWAVAEIPGAEPPAPAPAAKASAASSEPAKPADKARYGESVVRELLGAQASSRSRTSNSPSRRRTADDGMVRRNPVQSSSTNSAVCPVSARSRLSASPSTSCRRRASTSPACPRCCAMCGTRCASATSAAT